MTTDLVTLIANVALTLSFVVALIFGIAQIKDAKTQRRDGLTLKTISDFQSREFAGLIHYINSHKLPASQKEMQALPAEDQVTLIHYGQKMEALGILVAKNFINIDLLDITLGSFITYSWKKYEPMFLDIRKNANDPFLGEYFQWLAAQMTLRDEKKPRQPFHETGKTYSEK